MSSGNQVRDLEQELFAAAVVRLRARVIALVFAMVGGAGLFLTTAWLVVRGGQEVGLHLGLLGNYLPGYTVTWAGAFLGAFYGAVGGALIGWATAWIYNRVSARLRSE